MSRLGRGVSIAREGGELEVRRKRVSGALCARWAGELVPSLEFLVVCPPSSSNPSLLPCSYAVPLVASCPLVHPTRSALPPLLSSRRRRVGSRP